MSSWHAQGQGVSASSTTPSHAHAYSHSQPVTRATTSHPRRRAAPKDNDALQLLADFVITDELLQVEYITPENDIAVHNNAAALTAAIMIDITNTAGQTSNLRPQAPTRGRPRRSTAPSYYTATENRPLHLASSRVVAYGEGALLIASWPQFHSSTIVGSDDLRTIPLDMQMMRLDDESRMHFIPQRIYSQELLPSVTLQIHSDEEPCYQVVVKDEDANMNRAFIAVNVPHRLQLYAPSSLHVLHVIIMLRTGVDLEHERIIYEFNAETGESNSALLSTRVEGSRRLHRRSKKPRTSSRRTNSRYNRNIASIQSVNGVSATDGKHHEDTTNDRQMVYIGPQTNLDDSHSNRSISLDDEKHFHVTWQEEELPFPHFAMHTSSSSSSGLHSGTSATYQQTLPSETCCSCSYYSFCSRSRNCSCYMEGKACNHCASIFCDNHATLHNQQFSASDLARYDSAQPNLSVYHQQPSITSSNLADINNVSSNPPSSPFLVNPSPVNSERSESLGHGFEEFRDGSATDHPSFSKLPREFTCSSSSVDQELNTPEQQVLVVSSPSKVETDQPTTSESTINNALIDAVTTYVQQEHLQKPHEVCVVKLAAPLIVALIVLVRFSNMQVASSSILLFIGTCTYRLETNSAFS